MTPNRAKGRTGAKADSLRSIRADAVWTALPVRDQNLLLWLLDAEIVTAKLAALLCHGQLRTAQRRLARLVELGILRAFWAANSLYPRGRHAYVLTPAARAGIERLVWPEGHSDRTPRLPASGSIHQLATLDLLASFVAMAEPEVPVGLLAWVPERAAAAYLGGYVRPDAIGVVRVRDRLVTLPDRLRPDSNVP